MQKMMIYWQSVIPQHVLGVFTPIIRRAELHVTAYGFLSSAPLGTHTPTVTLTPNLTPPHHHTPTSHSTYH